MEEQKKNNSSKLIIGILLAIVAILAFMLTRSKGDVSDLQTTKERLSFDIEEKIAQLEDMESENDSLDAYIVQEIAYLRGINDSISQINQANEAQIQKLNSRVWGLKQREKKFITQIDSINAAYEVLRMEKEKVEMALVEEQVTNSNLSTENMVLQKEVAIGSMLQATSFEATAMKIYNSGKQKATLRARRAGRIYACATIAKNLLAQGGTRTIYMRITTSENTVLANTTEEESSFDFNGQPLMYSTKMDFEYSNEISVICMNYDKEEFSAGDYTIEMFTEGYKLGETKLTLR